MGIEKKEKRKGGGTGDRSKREKEERKTGVREEGKRCIEGNR